MKKAYIIHENQQWSDPLFQALDAKGVPFEDWFLDTGLLDLTTEPPEGIFYNRMSASSHTRDHRFAPEYTAAVLAWLESHGRRVLNSGRALQLELSKVAQYAELSAKGIQTPQTIAVIGSEGLVTAASKMGGPFITKHNRAGKGLGVRLFQSVSELQTYLDKSTLENPIDGITLIQQYIQSPEPFITRCEFVGQEFLYAVRVDTSDGFLLCPADECQDEDATVCPATSTAKFEILDDFSDPIIEDYRQLLIDNQIHIAGIEFIRDAKGRCFTYDINTNTNYNPAAESRAGQSGMNAIASYIERQLEDLTAHDAQDSAILPGKL
ncbi:MAG: alpha-L-glutamate ligase [Planctomycetota bacterium]